MITTKIAKILIMFSMKICLLKSVNVSLIFATLNGGREVELWYYGAKGLLRNYYYGRKSCDFGVS